jgi:hypothetical protein
LSQFKDIYESFVGNSSFTGVTSDALVYIGSGRLVTLSVVTAGTGGTINDSETVANASSSNAICAIPTVAGTYSINFPFSDGLVIKPTGTSVISVSYSEG